MNFLAVIIFINGIWVAGDSLDGWHARPYKDFNQCQMAAAEGEYIHHLPATLFRPDSSRHTPTSAKVAGHEDTEPIWRADQPPIQYLTHDLGPLLEVLDDRCVSVSCRSAPFRSIDAPRRSDGQIAIFQTAKGTLIKIMVTLSNREIQTQFFIFSIRTRSVYNVFKFDPRNNSRSPIMTLF